MSHIVIDIDDNTGDLKVLETNGSQAVGYPGPHDIKENRNIHIITVVETGNTHCIIVAGIRYCW